MMQWVKVPQVAAAARIGNIYMLRVWLKKKKKKNPNFPISDQFTGGSS